MSRHDVTLCSCSCLSHATRCLQAANVLIKVARGCRARLQVRKLQAVAAQQAEAVAAFLILTEKR